MPTLIYNNNTYVKWEKTDCFNYTITNLLNYGAVEVVIRDLTSDFTKEFTLQEEESVEVVLPYDGVYEICAVFLASSVVDEYIAQPTSFTQSVVNMGLMIGQDDARILRIDVVGVGTIYQSTADGGSDPDNNWTSPPTSYQSVLNVVNAWLASNGGGGAAIIPPNTPNPLFPWVVNPDNWLFFFYSQLGYEIEVVVTEQQFPPGTPQSNVFHFPDIDCIVNWAAEIENLVPEREYATSLILDGVNVLTEPVFIGDEDGVQNFFDIITTYLNSTGGGGIIDTNDGNLWWVFENCATPGALTLANLNPTERECDYIYEFCDTYACITRLMQQWLCNPCPDPCDPDYVDSKSARDRAIELSTLFFHALMPIVAQDRMWYLGNWAVNDQRVCNVNEIIDLYKELRDFLKSCGFDCCNPCKPDCGCGPCDPPSGNYPVTGKNDCGCK